MERINSPPVPPPVGGWLLLLCRLFVLWQPIRLALAVSTSLDALQIRGLPLAIGLLARLVVTAVGIGAGLALLHRRPGAAAFAKLALGLSFVMDLVIYMTPIFPSNRMPGTTPLYLGASLAYHAIWIAYLFRSTRVRQTYAD